VRELMEPGTEDAFAELRDAIPGDVPTVASPGPLSEVQTLIRQVMAAEGAHCLGHYPDRDAEQVHPVYRELIEEGRRLPASTYLRARDLRGPLARAMAAVLEEVDVLITPATPGEAPSRDTTGNPAFCSLWSFTGLPAVTLPLLTGPAGLPLGVQLVGAPGDDARLLRTARWLVRTLASDGEAT
jgi:Asp-tRNA(Asn)/Glu-tRNA(Gln) amidotransferase A subunit family amidase